MTVTCMRIPHYVLLLKTITLIRIIIQGNINYTMEGCGQFKMQK